VGFDLHTHNLFPLDPLKKLTNDTFQFLFFSGVKTVSPQNDPDRSPGIPFLQGVLYKLKIREMIRISDNDQLDLRLIRNL
jgi:hypothetical protein